MLAFSKKMTYLTAVLVIIAAVFVVIGGVVTPYLDARRGDIETWASQLLQEPIKIEKARVSWFQYQPGVALHNVTMLDAKTSQPLLQVRTVKVFFSIPQSIWQRKLVPSGIMIEGTDLVVHQNESGEFSLQGFPAIGGYDTQPFQNETKMNDVLGFLSTQPLLLLRDIDIRYTGITGQKRYFTLFNLRLENSGNNHTVAGKAILHQDLATEMAVGLRWQGDILKPETIEAKAYIHFTGLSLAQWFKDLVWHDLEIKNGIASAQCWATWRQGEFKSIQSTFEVYNLDMLANKKKLQHIERLSADVGWKKEGKDHIIAGDDILIDVGDHLWPVTSFYIKMTADETTQSLMPATVHVGYLDLKEVRKFLVDANAPIPEAVLKPLSELDLRGELENLAVNFANENGSIALLKAQGLFNHLSIKSYHGLPALQNISGKVTWGSQEGQVDLNSRDMTMTAETVFDEPIALSQFTGRVHWILDDKKQWQIDLQKIHVLNRDISVNAEGTITLNEKLQPEVNIAANLALNQAQHIKYYLPLKIFDKSLSDWLRSAFLTGRAESGSLLLKGKLTDFPFDHDNGVFKIEANVKNVQLHYAPKWPDLTNINAHLLFISRQITIDVDSARMLDIAIGKTHGDIPYLGDKGPAVLTVTAEPIHTDFADGIAFLHKSPLEDSIGKMFRNMEVSGPIDLTLGLTIPLDDPEKTKVKGLINISSGTLSLVPWKLDINKLSGVVNFTESSTDANSMTAQLFDKPMRLDLATIKKDKDNKVVRATVTNNIALQDIENWLKIPISEHATGDANAITQIDLSVDQPIDIHIDSNLKGIALNLPDQFGKKADESRNFLADMTIAEDQPLKIKANYNNLLNIAAILNMEHQHFSLRKMDISVSEINLYGVHLTNASLQLEPAAAGWNVQIDSPEIAGSIKVPAVINASSTLTLDLKHIDVDALSKGKATKTTIEAKTLPTINFDADSLIYDGTRLGSVSIETKPTQQGLAITSLSINSTNLNLQASGDWQQSTKGSRTSLHGKGQSKNTSRLLEDLGFDVHNFVASDGQLEFDLSWSDAPYNLSLANMSGSASLSMGKGRIVEISESTNAKMDFGRMLNLFSLQSIPRRLSLDFSDLFQKGYAFDTLRGDFRFNNGSATTQNMRFDGPIARVEIHGRIGLSHKDFDLVLNVTPYVTSSIPVAATLITGQPVVGIAAWAVNKMIGGEVSKVVTYYYSVSGSWANPVWSAIHKPGG